MREAAAEARCRALRDRLNELHYYQPLDVDSSELVERILGDLVASVDKLVGLRRQDEEQAERTSGLKSELRALEYDNPRLSADNNKLHLEIIDASEDAETREADARRRLRRLEEEVEAAQFSLRKAQVAGNQLEQELHGLRVQTLRVLEPHQPPQPSQAARGSKVSSAWRPWRRGARKARKAEREALRAKALSLEEALDDCGAQIADLEDEARRHEERAKSSEDQAVQLGQRLATHGPCLTGVQRRADAARLRDVTAELRRAVSIAERTSNELGARRAELTSRRDSALLEVAELSPALHALQGEEVRAARQAEALSRGSADQLSLEEQQLQKTRERLGQLRESEASLVEENQALAAACLAEANVHPKSADEGPAPQARADAEIDAGVAAPVGRDVRTQHLALRAAQLEAECEEAEELQASLEAQVHAAQASAEQALARAGQASAEAESCEVDARRRQQQSRQLRMRLELLRATLQDLEAERGPMLARLRDGQRTLHAAGGQRTLELRERTKRLHAVIQSLDGTQAQLFSELARASEDEQQALEALGAARQHLEVARDAHSVLEQEEAAAAGRTETAEAQRADLSEEASRWESELKEEARLNSEMQARAVALRAAAARVEGEMAVALRTQAALQRRAREGTAELRRVAQAAAAHRARSEALRDEEGRRMRQRVTHAEHRLERMQRELEEVVGRHGAILEEMKQVDSEQQQREAEAKGLAERVQEAEREFHELAEARSSLQAQLAAATTQLAQHPAATSGAGATAPALQLHVGGDQDAGGFGSMATAQQAQREALRVELGELASNVAAAEASRQQLSAELDEAKQQLEREGHSLDALGLGFPSEERALAAEVRALQQAAAAMDAERDERRRVADQRAEEAAAAERTTATERREAAEARQAAYDLQAAADTASEQLRELRVALVARRERLMALLEQRSVLQEQAQESSGEASTIMEDLMHMTRENQSLHEEIRGIEQKVNVFASQARNRVAEQGRCTQQLQAIQLERDDVARLYQQVCLQTRAQSATIEQLQAEGSQVRCEVGELGAKLKHGLEREGEWQAQSEQVGTDLAIMREQLLELEGRLQRAEACHREALEEDARLEADVAAAAELCRGAGRREAAQLQASAALRARREQLHAATQRTRAEAQAQRRIAAEDWEQVRRLEALLDEGRRQLGAREAENEALRKALLDQQQRPSTTCTATPAAAAQSAHATGEQAPSAVPTDASSMRAEVEQRYAEVGELDAEQRRLLAEVLSLRAALRQRAA